MHREEEPVVSSRTRFAASSFSCLFILAAYLTITPARGQEEPPAADSNQIAAKVGEFPIAVQDVNREVRALQRLGSAASMPLALMQAQILAKLVNQALVDAYCQREGLAVSDEETARDIKRYEDGLLRQKISLADFLLMNDHTEESFRREVRSNATRNKLFVARLSQEIVQDHFESHREEFDGTQLRVAHILMRPGASTDRRATEALVQRAAKLKELIDAGRLTFDEAARRYSAGPSRNSGGEFGAIPRRGLVVDAFSDTAFALADGAISDPVVTPFGVHLIRRIETKPGSIAFDQPQVKEAVKNAAALQLVVDIAEQERKKTRIEYTGAVPYVNPETNEFVLQGAATFPSDPAAKPPREANDTDSDAD